MSYDQSIKSFFTVTPKINLIKQIDLLDEDGDPYQVDESNQVNPVNPVDESNLSTNIKELEDTFVEKWYPYYTKLLNRLPPFANKSKKYSQLVKNIISDSANQYYKYRVVYLGLLTKMFYDKKEIKQYILPGHWEDEVDLQDALRECLSYLQK